MNSRVVTQDEIVRDATTAESLCQQQSVYGARKAQRYPYETISPIEHEHFWFVARNERIAKIIQDHLENWRAASFLEIGSGTGIVLSWLFQQGMRNIQGFEINEVGLELSRLRYPQIRFENVDCLDAKKQFSSQFDGIGMFDVVEHFPDDLEILSRVYQLLKPGGKLFLTVPAHQFLFSDMDHIFGHYRRYSKETLRSVLSRAGFVEIEMTYFLAPLVPLMFVHRRRMPNWRELNEEQLEEIISRENTLPPTPINSVMRFAMRMEHKLLGARDLGFGSSLVACVMRPL